MARRTVFTTGALLAAFAVAACGGGTATQGPGGTAGPGGPGGPGATAGAVNPQDPCSLLTVEEAAGVMNTDPVTAVSTGDDPATCTYSLEGFDGDALTITVLREGAAAQYDTLAGGLSDEDVPGVGDKATFDRSSITLVFMSGELYVWMHSRYIGGADASLVAYTTIGKIITARLTTGTVPPELSVTAPPVLSAETACDLLSAAEAASVLGQGAITATGSEFTPQFCSYSLASGEVVIATYLDPRGGSTAWDSFAASLTVEPVSGLGEQAMFEPSTDILFVLQGDSILNVNVFVGGLDDTAALALDRQLMEIMLGHL